MRCSSGWRSVAFACSLHLELTNECTTFRTTVVYFQHSQAAATINLTRYADLGAAATVVVKLAWVGLNSLMHWVVNDSISETLGLGFIDDLQLQHLKL